MRTRSNRPSHRPPIGPLAALGLIGMLFLGCGGSTEKPMDAPQSAAAVRSENLERPASTTRSAGGHEADSPPIRTRSLPTETTEVSITANEPTAPVLLAPGPPKPPTSDAPSPNDGKPGDDIAEDIAAIGPVDAASAETFDALATAYRDHQPTAYENAEGRLVARGVAAVPVLLAKLADPRTETRELASMMVLRIVPETILVDVTYPLDRRTAVLARLAKSLDDPSADVRANVASTLALFPEDMPGLLPALRKLLTAEMPYQRLMAVVAIGNLGPKASAATADVAGLLQDTDPDVQKAAKQTLELIRPIDSGE